ncbi:MAG: AraC family transcriptional regulator [Alphaproteobacteria bacterium]|nr:AraC family transcriptional regulator [Alphaproteobacteria bacterium]MCZ6589943.1 AraC family transcriptional regulator [Alphaproteobacteria bacterium]
MLLDRLLEGLDVKVAPFAICEIRHGASAIVEDKGGASLHYVLEGAGIARTLTGAEYRLTPHTVLIAPPDTCLVISCGEGRTMQLPAPVCRSLPGGWDWLSHGEGPPGLMLACGAVRATHHHTTGLFDYLRAPLLESVSDDSSFREPFQRLLKELADPGPGAHTLTELLLKQCLISLLRRHCQADKPQVPWLAALEHPQLGRAIGAMLDQPDRPFTLQSLADIAGMSRATFAEQFRLAFDRTAMEFLYDIRMRKAAKLLKSTDFPIKKISANVGFASRSHFSRAFKEFAGVDPTTFRIQSAD